MKIIHVIESSGGSADFVLYLMQYLPQHDHCVIHGQRTFGNRHDAVVRQFSSASFYLWSHAQREIRLLKDIRSAFALGRLLRNIPSDAIHLHSSKAGFVGRLVCFFLRRKNVIYTPNGAAFLRTDVSPFKVFLYKLFEKSADLFSGRVVSCSRSEANAMQDIGIKSTYVNNGTRIFKSAQVPSASIITICTVGRVTVQKNPSLFNSIAESFQHDAAVKFIWIGGGELEHELTSSNITVTGWMERSDVVDAVAATHLYISTASWEGLPFAVLEAMSIEKPLLLSRCVGNIDLVQEGINGFLFDNAEQAVEHIRWFINNPTALVAFGKSSLRLIEKDFTVEAMASQYEKIYRRQL